MKYLRKLFYMINDPDRSFEDRKIIMMTVIVFPAVFLVLIGDIIEGENIVEIITLILSCIIVPPITILSVAKGRAKIGVMCEAIGVVFIILPITFFFGGGLKGGAPFWIPFGFLYTGLIVSGVVRLVLLTSLTLIALAEVFIEYNYPQLIFPHSWKLFFTDAGISIIVVGFLIFTMVWFQNHMFEMERQRAEEAAELAEELNRSQNQFFSSMSHEIRTPINTVLGLNEIILRQEDASEEIVRDAKKIRGAGKMLLALINDILDISKIEAGKMEIVPVSYSVGNMVSEIVNMIWLKAEEKGLRFQVDIDPSIPTMLYGDEVRVKQILINLLNNAVKYTSEGSVSLHMECERSGEEHILLKTTVSDTGMGIRQEDIPHLFDSFRRVDEEKNTHIEGTGLGLSIVKNLVDLMHGEINVNSVYGQGSVFMLTIRQKIESGDSIGDLNITGDENSGVVEKFRHLFTAPQARILIVDDNEMNLQVESRLLDGMEMTVDLARSGEAALSMTLKNRYDVILLDHLMPGMDGIECFREIRRQLGGLCTDVPIIVLTANAGGENTELYEATGFNGQLTKPVSGMQLEETLVRFLPEEKVILSSEQELTRGRINTAGRYARKAPVVIATSSMCDLPDAILRESQIHIIPFRIRTDRGLFWDGVETVSDELIRYMSTEGNTVASDPPSVEEFMEFFSSELREAHHVIYITITTSMSEEYERATAAARNFENVSVVNSEVLSSATGILALIAQKMVQHRMSVGKILRELEIAKKYLHCSFVIADTEFMTRGGHISPRANSALKTFRIRPSLRIKNDKSGVDRIHVGSIERCYTSYIRRALPMSAHPDEDVIFVTYADISEETILWIEEMIRKRANFKNILFKKASAAISSNCGPGTFGLLYMDRGKTVYNLDPFIPLEMDQDETDDVLFEEEDFDASVPTWKAEEPEVREQPEKAWYMRIEGIDGAEAMKNCGNEELLRDAVKLYYSLIPENQKELRDAYESGDREMYTIKVHALKSSSRMVGAMELGDDAEALEMAGKEGNTDYIKANHDRVMEMYDAYRERLREVIEGFGEDSAVADSDTAGAEGESDLPPVDEALLRETYDRLLELSESCDDAAMEEVLEGLSGYRLPEEDEERIEKIRQALDDFEYEEVRKLISAGN